MLRPNDLISKEYVEAQKYLHAQPNGYGGKGRKWAPFVLDLMIEYDCWSVLDYGCGEGSLVRELSANGLGDYRLRDYDPAIPGKDDRPGFADCVVCTDVMEHVEANKFANVILHLSQLTRIVCFVVVSLVETSKTLPDGRQAHVSVHPVEFWREAFRKHFTIVSEPQIKPEKQWIAILTP